MPIKKFLNDKIKMREITILSLELIFSSEFFPILLTQLKDSDKNPYLNEYFMKAISDDIFRLAKKKTGEFCKEKKYFY
jgi:hypothetical protein